MVKKNKDNSVDINKNTETVSEDQDKVLESFESGKSHLDKDEEKRKEKAVDPFSKFICVVNKPLYYLIFCINVIILLMCTQYILVNVYLIYIISMVCFTVSFTLLYKLCKKHKEKVEELNIHKVTFVKKLLFVMLSVVVGIVASVISAAFALQNSPKLEQMVNDYSTSDGNIGYDQDLADELAGETQFIDNFAYDNGEEEPLVDESTEVTEESIED